jgi:hypothetical protein
MGNKTFVKKCIALKKIYLELLGKGLSLLVKLDVANNE